MTIKTVLILSPGEMGAAVGNVFHENGFEILGILQGRSEATRNRAKTAGFGDAKTLEAGIKRADIIFSILPPAEALSTASSVATVMKSLERHLPYVDCNAISPDTAKEVARVIEAAGGNPIDGGIVGNPPGGSPKPTRFFVSGPSAATLDIFDGKGIAVKQCGPHIGQGSAVKMVYAGITKGVSALCANMLIAAERLGVADIAHEEFQYSQEALYRRMENLTPALPAVSERYIGEMEEIALTCQSIGLSSGFHDGAADLYRLMERSPYANEIRETVDKKRGLRATIKGCSEVDDF
ncbi:MAG: DUF1932 domain-containing protein [Rhodospirillaceae bacterium]|jgi:3-hydroxyisobutyrate dehydrogenase-like beta-hydroxyacid dehydrogenase